MFCEVMFPATVFGELGREMNRLFDARYQGVNVGLRPRNLSFPKVNIWEDEDRFLVEAEIPGLTMNDIEVEVIGNELTIKGQQEADDEHERTCHRRERGTGAFNRLITLPVDVNPDKVGAVLKNGVLTITLPKHPETRPKRIEVRKA